MKKYLKRVLNPVNWHNLRSTEPVSRVFGNDRGTAIDRVYIEHFLNSNSHYITNRTLEIAEETYCKRFGSNIEKQEILHYGKDNPNATIIGDLTNPESLPSNAVDCFVCTQTFNFIYDYKSAIKGAWHLLAENGVVLATVGGISQISRYDMDRWGDYWRFNDLSIRRSFEDVFGEGNVEVETYGNVLTAMALLQGISAEELSREEIFHKDPDYQVIIGIIAKKKTIL